MANETQFSPVPVAINVGPLKSSRVAVDIPGFFDTVAEALAIYIQTEFPPDQTTPVLVHEFPRERIAKPDDKFDVVSYRVVSSNMAPTRNDGAMPRGPKLRESKPHPDLAGFNLQVMGWWELVQAEFSVWSKSNRNADLVTAWFHNFMMKYAHMYKFFMSRGISNFRFVKRADDDMDRSFGQELYRRRLTYEFRLETLWAVEHKQLTSLDIHYGVSGANDEIEVTPDQ